MAVGSHRRLPRRYRGVDIWTWLRLTGEMGRAIDEVGDPDVARRAPSAALSGQDGGRPLDLGVLASLGVQLRGRLVRITGGTAQFDSSLPASVQAADDRLHATLGEIDRYALRHFPEALGLEPVEPIEPVVVRDAGPVLRLGRPTTVVW